MVWTERLASFPFELGVKNLNSHIDSSRFFPSISDIMRTDVTENEFAGLEETAERMALMDSWEAVAVDCPEHLKPKFLRSGSDD